MLEFGLVSIVQLVKAKSTRSPLTRILRRPGQLKRPGGKGHLNWLERI